MVKNRKSKGRYAKRAKSGLELADYEIFSKSLQCAWVKRMKEGIGKQWMEIPSFYLENLGGPFIFDCDYDLRLLNLSNMPAFLISIFSKRGLKFRGCVMLISTKIILEVVYT